MVSKEVDSVAGIREFPNGGKAGEKKTGAGTFDHMPGLDCTGS